tara:strand:- start:197 stop:427 length:231 start_codon:yes stop_codon:yes gene_type:complete
MKLNRKSKKKSLLEFKENQKFTLLGSIRLRNIADSKFIPNAICKGFSLLKLSLAKDIFTALIKIGTSRPTIIQKFT